MSQQEAGTGLTGGSSRSVDQATPVSWTTITPFWLGPWDGGGGGGGGRAGLGSELHGTPDPSQSNGHASCVVMLQAPVAWRQHAPVAKGGQVCALHGTPSPSQSNRHASCVVMLQAPVAWSQHAPVGEDGGGQVEGVQTVPSPSYVPPREAHVAGVWRSRRG